MGAKRLSKVDISWSAEFAYAIGLIASDGNLSSDGRHINFTSKDFELASNFKRCLLLNNKIGRKSRGGSQNKKYFVVQFGDKNFYDYLATIGLTSAKSKTIGKLLIPNQYFTHFLRGCIDGDGNISIARHPESQHPQLRVRLCSASLLFLTWVKDMIGGIIKTDGGWIDIISTRRVNVLIFAKEDSFKLLKAIYPTNLENHLYLKRKLLVAEHLFGRVAELV